MKAFVTLKPIEAEIDKCNVSESNKCDKDKPKLQPLRGFCPLWMTDWLIEFKWSRDVDFLWPSEKIDSLIWAPWRCCWRLSLHALVCWHSHTSFQRISNGFIPLWKHCCYCYYFTESYQVWEQIWWCFKWSTAPILWSFSSVQCNYFSPWGFDLYTGFHRKPYKRTTTSNLHFAISGSNTL